MTSRAEQKHAAAPRQQRGAAAQTRDPRAQTKGPFPLSVARSGSPSNRLGLQGFPLVDLTHELEVDEFSETIGLYNVESRSHPGTMHHVCLRTGFCDCIAAVRFGKVNCSHRRAARTYRERKLTLRGELEQIKAEYGDRLFARVAEEML